MFGKIIKRIVQYFKNIFSNDIGEYNPKADKADFQSILYWIIGLILCYIIPTVFVYLEVGEFDLNVFRFIWGEESNELYHEGIYRLGYWGCGVCTVLAFIAVGFLSPYRVNGKEQLLDFKKTLRCLCAVCFSLFIVCFIVSIIVY